jgi:hypothetical protein
MIASVTIIRDPGCDVVHIVRSAPLDEQEHSRERLRLVVAPEPALWDGCFGIGRGRARPSIACIRGRVVGAQITKHAICRAFMRQDQM